MVTIEKLKSCLNPAVALSVQCSLVCLNVNSRHICTVDIFMYVDILISLIHSTRHNFLNLSLSFLSIK